MTNDPMLVTDVKPRPLSYSLDDYHRAPSEGTLYYTWQDKPHRLLYDLIAAVAYYAGQQPATQTADVTDEQIVSVMRDGNNCQHNDEADHIQFARAILALRPERVRMTDEQIRSMCKQEWVFETARQWVHVIEAHHGITAQAKKETP